MVVEWKKVTPETPKYTINTGTKIRFKWVLKIKATYNRLKNVMKRDLITVNSTNSTAELNKKDVSVRILAPCINTRGITMAIA